LGQGLRGQRLTVQAVMLAGGLRSHSACAKSWKPHASRTRHTNDGAHTISLGSWRLAETLSRESRGSIEPNVDQLLP
jgi:hypothetical protein